MKKIKALYKVFEGLKSISNQLKQLNTMTNLKDKVTTVAGILLFLCGLVATVATAGIALPAVVITGATAVAAVSASTIAYLTGKNPDGSTKTVSQVTDANAGK